MGYPVTFVARAEISTPVKKDVSALGNRMVPLLIPMGISTSHVFGETSLPDTLNPPLLILFLIHCDSK